MVSNLTLKIGADIGNLQKELQQATSHMQGFSKGMNNIGKQIAGAFAFSELVSLGKNIFNATAQFQKFEAVLTNTLGSNSAAQAALNQITEFAAKTPFQVDELTGSFVKLANQGFLPTMNQMRSLGDLAASMGKSFDQLTEAIIDAQTGEFERLKEFGIRAQKEGDRVSFTFKGVKTQVDFTADSIRQYILSLGQAEGVSGGMEKQSKTLGGQLSNLKDAWNQLQVAIGTSAESGGALSKGLEILTQMVNATRDIFDPVHRLQSELKLLTRLRQEAWAANDIERAADLNVEMIKVQSQLNALTEKTKAGEIELANVREGKSIPAIKAQTKSIKELLHEWDKQFSIHKKDFDPTDGIQKKTGFDFMFDSGAMAEMANAGSSALAKLGERLKINTNEFQVWASQVSARMQQTADKITIDFAPVITSALSGIGHALGNAINGSAKLGDSLLKVLGGVLIQLGEMLIQTGVGIKAFQMSLSSMNWALAIGAGVALVALGTAVAGSMKSLGSSAGSSHSSAAQTGSRGGSSRGSLDSGGIQIQVGGEFRIQGTDLVYIFNRQQQLNGRTRG